MTDSSLPARSLRIAWLHSHFLHFHSGGTQFVCNFAEHLQRALGCSVRFVVDVAAADARRFCTARDLALVELDRSSTNSPWYWLTLGARLRSKRPPIQALVAEADVVVSSMFPMNLLAGAAGKRHVQICFEPFAFFHDEECLAALTAPQRAFFRAMKLRWARADREAVRAADRVVTVNASNVERFRQVYGVEPAVVYLGYDSGFWRRPPADVCAAWRARWGEGPLLFHSTDLSGIKGTFELLAVVEQLARAVPSIKLLVTVYVDNPSGRAHFDAEVRERRLGRNVAVLGRVSRDELPTIYGAVDAVVQPGNQPANGALREALLCETPIIGGPASEEVIDERNGVRIDARRAEGAAERVRWLLAHRTTLDVAGAGRSFIESRFPFARSVESLKAILDAAATRP